MRHYLRVLRAHRLLVVGGILACTIVAAALAWLQAPTYTAKTQLFVAASGTAADPGLTYQGGLFSEERVLSYVQMVSNPAVLNAVIKQLRLPESIDELSNKVQASVPTGTALLDISVDDSSASRAALIARTLAARFSAFVSRLETPPGADHSRVDISVTSLALAPTSPSAPQKSVYLALGIILGLVVGIGGAFTAEALGQRVLDEDDAAAAAGVPVLGSVADAGGGKRRSLVMTAQPFSQQAEGYRRLRANVESMFDNRDVGAFVVTSARPSEGKTFVAANLAVAFARGGHRVAVVDANLRHPRLAELFGRSPSIGVVNVVRDGLELVPALQASPADVPLTIVASGPEPQDPSELIGSPAFGEFLDELKERFELVILDAPSLLGSTDAAVLARRTAGAVLVARAGVTRAHDLARAAESLNAVDATIFGIVLNRRARRGRAVGAVPRRGPKADSALDGERVSAL